MKTEYCLTHTVVTEEHLTDNFKSELGLDSTQKSDFEMDSMQGILFNAKAFNNFNVFLINSIFIIDFFLIPRSR